MRNQSIIAFIMAGGQGSRLQPLTSERSKPAVPFGARSRIVDFVLSNFVNSEIHTIYLLVQYRSQSLIEHIRKAWRLSPLVPSQFITVVPPQMMEGEQWFQGTADAVHQNLNLIENHTPDLVAVFGADHIYRMDIRQMVDFHNAHEADVTVSVLPVALEAAAGFGIIATDGDGRISEFQEKPEHPAPMPGNPGHALASMGNYLFKAEVLVEALLEAKRRGETDFGHHILPRLMKSHRLYAYNFGDNEVPGMKPYEERGYWRDVGTIDAYMDAHFDVMGLEPRLDVFNTDWPIFSSNYQGPVARVISGEIENSLLGSATLINGGKVKNTIIRREAVVEPGAELEECIIMDYVHIGRGAKLRKVIVDRHNFIEPGTRIGFDPQEDRKRYTVTDSGIVVVPRGRVGYYARDSHKKGRVRYSE
ncbi:MAG: glucose-1-phosphate adenylyltransferase [Pseudomonadota bacterium]|nr:glucose-1-phosphate adenylyltransferase [Pseudomonadota bacterium]